MSGTIIVWFRRDLRLNDNLALSCARKDGIRLIPVYVHSPGEEDPWRPGAASRWWLHHSLQSLDGGLQALGLQLLILRGDTLSMLMLLGQRNGAEAVYWNRLYDPATVRRDARIKTGLESVGVRTRSFPGYLLREPWEVMTAAETPYKVFTPYSRASFRLEAPPKPVRPPR
ncbi:MAG: deoxyribodipyrimidine photo-lyase, partial [Arenicellales bacterium]